MSWVSFTNACASHIDEPHAEASLHAVGSHESRILLSSMNVTAESIASADASWPIEEV